jgi:hypothetical protein
MLDPQHGDSVTQGLQALLETPKCAAGDFKFSKFGDGESSLPHTQ